MRTKMKLKTWIGTSGCKVTLPILCIILALNACQNSKGGQEQDVPDGPITDFIYDQADGFEQCHASTIARMANGEFVVAWFGGTAEKDDDVGIWMSTGTPGHWTKPIELEKLREDPHWNPVLFRAPDDRIILYFKVGKEIPTWETWYTVSTDNAKTWSKAAELVPGDRGGRGPVKNKAIVLSNGDWLAPASHEEGPWRAFVDRSTDGGLSWTAEDYVPMDTTKVKGKGAIQPTLWESQPGHVHMLLRTSSGFIGRSDSEDYGHTWTEMYDTGLPNPNSGIDLVKLPGGELVLVYNPDDKNWGDRAPLTLAISEDNGKTWPWKLDIETGHPDDEFSYPSIISWDDTIAVVYTWQREKVAFYQATLEEIKAEARRGR